MDDVKAAIESVNPNGKTMQMAPDRLPVVHGQKQPVQIRQIDDPWTNHICPARRFKSSMGELQISSRRINVTNDVANMLSDQIDSIHGRIRVDGGPALRFASCHFVGAGAAGAVRPLMTAARPRLQHRQRHRGDDEGDEEAGRRPRSGSLAKSIGTRLAIGWTMGALVSAIGIMVSFQATRR